MARWEYITLIYGTADRYGRRWVVTAPEIASESRQVGKAEKGRFSGKIWQAMRLLESALVEFDAEGGVSVHVVLWDLQLVRRSRPEEAGGEGNRYIAVRRTKRCSRRRGIVRFWEFMAQRATPLLELGRSP